MEIEVATRIPMGVFSIFLRVILTIGRSTRPSRRSTAPARKPGAIFRIEPELRQSETILIGSCYVIDGDTIVIGNTRIRLAGIDAPELDHPWGQNAKWALIRLCRRQEVTAVFKGDLSHDRNVATCFLSDGRDLSAEMVKLGLAIDWPKYSGGKYRHLEPSGIRRKHWRAHARQSGRYFEP